MKTNKLRVSQAGLIVFFLMHGAICGAGLSYFVNISKENFWLAPIIGSFIGFIPFYIFITLSNNYKDKNIFEIINSNFKKPISIIINLFLIFFVFYFTCIAFWNLTNLISSQYLYQTPQSFIYIVFIIPLIYILSKDTKTIFRSCIILFIIVIIFHLISFISLVGQIQFLNFLPLLKDGINPIIKGSFGMIIYCVIPILSLNSISINEYEDSKDYKKKMILFYIISCISVCTILILIEGVIGYEKTMLYQYPEFQILRRVSIGGFIERVESTLSIHWIIEIFMTLVLGFYYIKKGISQNININNKLIKKNFIFVIVIVASIISSYMFKSNTNVSNFSYKIYPVIGFIFISISMIIYIISIIKTND